MVDGIVCQASVHCRVWSGQQGCERVCVCVGGGCECMSWCHSTGMQTQDLQCSAVVWALPRPWRTWDSVRFLFCFCFELWFLWELCLYSNEVTQWNGKLDERWSWKNQFCSFKLRLSKLWRKEFIFMKLHKPVIKRDWEMQRRERRKKTGWCLRRYSSTCYGGNMEWGQWFHL